MSAEPEDSDRFNGWRTDWERLRNDVHLLFACRHIFRTLDDELVRSRRLGRQLILDKFLRPMYFEAQAVRLRRLADKDTRTISFRRLLLEMAKQSGILSRDRYINTVLDPAEADDDARVRFVSGLFDQLAGVGAESVDPAILKGYADELDLDAKKVSDYVDQHVAHRDRLAAPPIKWGALDTAIDALGKHYSRIGTYLTGSYHVAEIAVASGWERVFSPGLFLPNISGWECADWTFS